MEHYDSQMAARVWQRVQSSDADTASVPDIQGLLQAESTDLSHYRQLSGQRGQAGRSELSLLSSKTKQCISTLNGIWFLLTDSHPEIVPSPLPKELPISSLRRCYGSTLQRLSHYEQWLRHTEFAPGFFLLSKLSRERCQLLLQLLGNYNHT